MDVMLLASLYDYRWLAFGWPKNLGYFDIHADITTSNLFYAVAYLQTQMLTLALMYSTTEEKLEFTGISYLIDAVTGGAEADDQDANKITSILAEEKKEAKYTFVEVLGYKFKEFKLFGHL